MLLHFDPFLGAVITPLRDGSQDHLLSYRHRKTVYQAAGEVIALMAAFIRLFGCARPNLARSAVLEERIGHAPFADYLIRCDAIKGAQTLLEFFVPLYIRHANTANTAIEPAWG